MRVVVVVGKDDEACRGHAVTGALAGDAVNVGEGIAERRLHEGVGVDFGSAVAS